MDFEKQFELFVEQQRAGASGLRLERLSGDLTGTKKMFKEALWPVFQTFEGFVLEYELMNSPDQPLFVNALNVPYWTGFESEDYFAYVETLTNEQFNTEQLRIRHMVMLGILYCPFSWDELDMQPELCRESVHTLLVKHSRRASIELSLTEKEALVALRMMGRPFRMKDVNDCLGNQDQASLMVIRKLLDKKLILPLHDGKAKNHYFIINNEELRKLMR
ncbi:hypothetical protein [Paenibacillus soyae]|uniref:Uncharacterized protein n=1 Tax=Paenibacillus soyae TaxID=2969249 RepID=A0A9X2SAK8_9BACL|nr:hypothetical protein [Paenibacillus soyae]MCR2806105.1 hypothetical protein [Paenibacillus soyae]